jgi:hypothetical protein
MGAADAQVHDRSVFRGGKGDVLRRLATMSHNYGGTQIKQGASQPDHCPRIDSKLSQEPAGDVQLDIGAEQNRFSREQGEDEMPGIGVVETIDQCSRVSLRSSGKVKRQDVDHGTKRLVFHRRTGIHPWMPLLRKSSLGPGKD